MPELPQQLEPNQRGVALYQDGQFLGYEDVVTLSDEELQEEADTARLKEIYNMSHSAINVPTLSEGFKILCKKLGYG